MKTIAVVAENDVARENVVDYLYRRGFLVYGFPSAGEYRRSAHTLAPDMLLTNEMFIDTTKTAPITIVCTNCDEVMNHLEVLFG